MTVGWLTVSDKCTWVAYGITKPPIFTLSDGPDKGINKNSSWVIHHMEYNGN